MNFLHGTQYGQRIAASKVGEHEILLATGKLHKLVWFSHVTPCDILLLFKEPWKIVSAEVNREKDWLAGWLTMEDLLTTVQDRQPFRPLHLSSCPSSPGTSS